MITVLLASSSHHIDGILIILMVFSNIFSIIQFVIFSFVISAIVTIFYDNFSMRGLMLKYLINSATFSATTIRDGAVAVLLPIAQLCSKRLSVYLSYY